VTTFVMPRLKLGPERLLLAAMRVINAGQGKVIFDLLRELDPKQARQATSFEVAYTALLNCCEKRFPLAHYAYEALDTGDPPAALIESGIPIELFGVDDEMALEDTSPAMALGMAERHGVESVSYVPALRAFAKIVQPLVASWEAANAGNSDPVVRVHVKAHPAPLLTLDGWTWKKDWQAFPDWYRYCLSDTNLGFLDYSMYEDVSFPAWNMGEINTLTEEWKAARPVWDRITTFTAFVDMEPKARLPHLVKLIMGDQSVLPDVARKAKQVTHA